MIVAVGVLHNIAIEGNDRGEGFEPLAEEVAAEIEAATDEIAARANVFIIWIWIFQNF